MFSGSRGTDDGLSLGPIRTPRGSVPNQAALPTGRLLCLSFMFPSELAVGYGRDSVRP
jgi:hypothetical protein